MRILVILFLCSFLPVINLYAQSSEDSVMYNRGIAILNEAKTTEKYLESAFYFDSLSREFPRQWLTYYYAGLSFILAAQKAPDSKYSGDLLNRAQPLIDKSFSLRQDEPELHVLQAFLYQVKLQADPQGRTLNFAQKADASLKKAIEADSANPRAYFLMAHNVYYTPPIFKGGPKNALPVFLKAKEKYNTFKSELAFLPSWGKDQNEEMIRVCKNSKN